MPRSTFARFALPLILAAGLLAGAVSVMAEDTHNGPAYSGNSVKTLTATLTGADGAAIGAVQLSQNAAGVVQITVTGSGLEAGDHGLHIHATGKCEGPAFTSAGGHFNPTAKKHGLDSADGPHAGDMPMLTVAANGTYSYVETSDRVSALSGATSILDADGAALIIHAGVDDHVTDPTGNSGARVACALLAAANPALATPVATTAPAPPRTGAGLDAAGSGNAFALVAGMAFLVIAGGASAVAIRRRS